MIKYFKIFENSLYATFKKAEEEAKISDDDEDVVFKDVIGLDPTLYTYKVEQQHYGDLSLFFKKKDLEDLFDVEEGILDFALQFTGYNDYYYEVDNSEVGYYLDKEGDFLIDKLFKMLDIKEKPDPENIYELFEALGDDNVRIYDITCEIDYQFTAAVEHNCLQALKTLPFDLSSEYGSKYNYELLFEFDKLEEYIEKNKLEDINTLGDLIEKLDISSTFNWSDLNNPWETDYDMKFDDIYKEFNNIVKKLIEELEKGMKEPEYKDPMQLDLFKDIDDEVIRKALEHQPVRYNYQYEVFKKMKIKDLRNAKSVGGKILGWFKSYEFQKNYIASEKNYDKKVENYELLRDEKIIHPAIVYEYEYLPEVEKYGL